MSGATYPERAFEAASKRAQGGGKAWRKYRSIALKLPVMIHNEGLLPALHFVAARGDAVVRAKPFDAIELALTDLWPPG